MLQGNVSEDGPADVERGLAQVVADQHIAPSPRLHGWSSGPIPSGPMDELEAGSAPIGGINPRDYRFVMALARRHNAIVFWHRDRNGIDWQPLLMPLEPKRSGRPQKV